MEQKQKLRPGFSVKNRLDVADYALVRGRGQNAWCNGRGCWSLHCVSLSDVFFLGDIDSELFNGDVHLVINLLP